MSSKTVSLGSPAQFSLRVRRGHAAEFSHWQASVAPMFKIAPLSPDRRAAFAMRTKGYFLSGMAITKTTSSGCTFKRSQALIEKSGIENILVQVYLKGSYRLDARGISAVIRPGDVVIFDMNRECTIDAKAYTNIALTLQRDMLSSMIVDITKLHGLVLRAGTPRNALLTSHLSELHARAAELQVTEHSAIAHGTAALVAACVTPSIDALEGRGLPDAQATLSALRQNIELRLGDMSIGPSSIAAEFGLSRASMYRMFEPLGGVRAYIQQRRLMHAYHRIANPAHFDEPINAIAKRLGFPESTSFSRAFRHLYKTTPKDVRDAAKAGRLILDPEPQSDDASYEMLNRWLLGLDANGAPDDQTRRADNADPQ